MHSRAVRIVFFDGGGWKNRANLYKAVFARKKDRSAAANRKQTAKENSANAQISASRAQYRNRPEYGRQNLRQKIFLKLIFGRIFIVAPKAFKMIEKPRFVVKDMNEHVAVI